MTGNDIEKRKQELRKILGNRDAHIFDDEFDRVAVSQISSGDLFGNVPVLVFRYVWDTDLKAWLRKQMKSDINTDVIIIENSLIKKEYSGFVEKGAVRKDYEIVQKAKKESFNVFSIVDAWARGDKKNTWLLYQQAMRSGIVPEQIHGIFMWKVRSSIEKNGKIHDKNPAEQSSKLISLYHDSRRVGPSITLALEHLILSI
ncbi:MAG: hypothetical protein OEZ01_10180 [Candidatus Heimdallarchaeota archaeon]|nr:hypothetical protein [Candidatus Nomurabacteria bacterium]MDH5646366.1 hypothetical protein [Candidatus Heimdallarchaeota archaeon]